MYKFPEFFLHVISFYLNIKTIFTMDNRNTFESRCTRSHRLPKNDLWTMTLELLWLTASWGRGCKEAKGCSQELHESLSKEINILASLASRQASAPAELLPLSLITREEEIPRKCPPASGDVPMQGGWAGEEEGGMGLHSLRVWDLWAFSHLLQSHGSFRNQSPKLI